MQRHRRVAGLVFVAAIFLVACEQQPFAPEAQTEEHSDNPWPEIVRQSFYAALDFGLLISPTGLDFGEVQVGSTSAQQMVTITNIASQPITMSGTGGAAGLFGGVQNCQGMTLAPDQSCQMLFQFTPTAAGMVTGASIGTWNGQEFNIAMRGTGTAPRFLVTPLGLDFGEVAVGTTSAQQSVTITNVGNGPVVMSGAGGAAGLFGGVQNCQGTTLAVGASCTMSFAFTPSAAGVATGASIGTWNGQDFNIAMRGVGVGPKFRISPSSLDFGEVFVGTTSPQQPVTITNVGPVPVVMSGAGGAAGVFGGVQNCQGTTLAVGASCQMFFAFTPSVVGAATGASIGSWNGVDFNIPMRGVGLAVGAPRTETFLISPSGLDFGDVQLGTTAPQQSVTITNVSNAAVVMSGAGGAAGLFGGVQNCQGTTLAVGASCQMFFAFTPTAAGGATGASIGNWNGQNFNIAMRGNGVHPTFRISPSAIDFGDVQLGTTSVSRSVTITNQGSTPVTMSGAGGAAGVFGGVQNCQGTTLAVGASCQMSFAFTPTAAGPATGGSIGNWNGVEFNIAMRGNGVPPRFLITPFSLDFGLVPVGVTSPQQSVRIINTGLAPVVMSGAGGAAGLFGGVQNCQGTTQAVGASCQMFFAFSPNAAGEVTGASIGNWNSQDFNIAMRGTGFADAAEYEMDLSPSTISLSGTTAVSAILLSTPTFDARNVTLANVRMLVNGTTDVAPVGRNGVVTSSVRDWNGDGLIDRMFSFTASSLAAAGLTTSPGPNTLILRDVIGAQKWTARDPALPTIVP